MPKVSSPDTYKVPAFQRKRSLSAKARRQAKPVTALDRMKAGVPFVKKKTVRRSAGQNSAGRRSVSRRSSFEIERRPISRDYDSGAYGDGDDSGRYLGREESSAFSQPLLSDDSYGEVMSRDSSDRDSRGIDSVSSDSGLKEMRTCGKVSGYLEKIQVAIVDVSSSIRAGDRVIFESEYGLFEQTVESMQIDRQDVVTAYSGDCIGMKVLAEPKKDGAVYKVV